jgi:hypothetical protein
MQMSGDLNAPTALSWGNSPGIPCGLHNCYGYREKDPNLYTSFKSNPGSRISQPLT